MTKEELKEIEERATYCRCWEPYVMITEVERNKLVELAKEALEARARKEAAVQMEIFC